jgi:hypothetical protein
MIVESIVAAGGLVAVLVGDPAGVVKDFVDSEIGFVKVPWPS